MRDDHAPELPIIVLTGFDGMAVANMAVREGAQNYLVKGEVDGDLLARSLHYSIERKQAEDVLRDSEERLKIKLDYILSPDNDVKNVSLTDLVGLEELQQIQDAFAAANDVASIISDIDGKPITRASNFCGVCEIIRSTEKGDINCRKSEKILGEKAKALMRPTYGQCLSCSFVDASAPIIVGSKHIANWWIGQSNAMRVDKNRIDIVIRGTGEFCEVRIADHGTGIPDEIKEHIFEENFADSDGFCGFQKISKESDSIHGSEEVQLMRTGCETPRFPHMRGLLLATTENSRTRNFVHGETGNTGRGLYIVRNAMES